MKAFIRFCWLLATLLLTAPVPGAGQGKQIVLANGEWPPYMSEKAPGGGVASAVISEALALEDYEVVYRWATWSGGFEAARNGSIHGAVAWHYNVDRAKSFYFSVPLFHQSYLLYHHKFRDFSWNNINDLQGLRIGANKGYYYGTPFMDAEAAGELDVLRVEREIQLIDMLARGRLDIIVLPDIVGRTKLDSHPDGSQITAYPRPLSRMSLHVLLSKEKPENEEVLEALNRGIKTLKEQGRWPELLK